MCSGGWPAGWMTVVITASNQGCTRLEAQHSVSDQPVLGHLEAKSLGLECLAGDGDLEPSHRCGRPDEAKRRIARGVEKRMAE